MRAVTWHRSLHRLPKQYRLRLQNRAFSASSRVPVASRPPNDPPNPDNHTSLADTSSEVKDAVSAGAKHAAERAGGRSIAGGRLARNGKARQGIAPPPPLPDWFLKYNVRLYEEAPAAKELNGTWRTLKLVDRETGHTVLRLPFVDTSADGGNEQSRSTMLKHGSTRPTSGFFDQRAPVGTEDKSAGILSAESGESKAGDGQVCETKVDQSRPSEKNANGSGETSTSRKRKGLLHELEANPNSSTWIRLQAQLLIHSAFSLPTLDSGAHSSATRSHFIFETPDTCAHEELDRFVEDVADLVGASIVRLDANDIAEIAGDYVGGNGRDGPNSISALPYDVYQGSTATQVHSATIVPAEFGSEDNPDQTDTADEEAEPYPRSGITSNFLRMLDQNKDFLSKALSGGKVGVVVQDATQHQPSEKITNKDGPALDPWEELKLEAVLDSVLGAVGTRQSAGTDDAPKSFLRAKFASPRDADLERFDDVQLQWHIRDHGLSRVVADHLLRRILPVNPIVPMVSEVVEGEDQPKPLLSAKGPRTIVHIRDIQFIRDTHQGEAVVRRLLKVVQKRRKDGEQIVIVGTSASAPVANIDESDVEDEESFFRTLAYPWKRPHSIIERATPRGNDQSLASPGYRRLMEINLRNIQDMVRRLGFSGSDELFTDATHRHLYLPGTADIGEYVLTSSEVQRLVLCANGLRALYTESPILEAIHISFAAMLLDKIDSSVTNAHSLKPQAMFSNIKVMERQGDAGQKRKQGPKRPNIEQIRKSSSKHEQRLLSGVVDPQNIKVTFDDVHAPAETIDALKTLTTLSLMRPEAFSYGVLANDRLSGLLLYGPPGTGKTLLAKAVAKESQATVLEVSGAQVYEKYVGEGEKMVRAVFSLAKKLSPCIVFIDEADALFGSRNAGNRTTHREIINQFLREWDGMDDHSVFMMVATNRPFDLDDAVLRRLPRRLLVDLPMAKDRESILGIHLKGETLDAGVSLSSLAEQTPLYSGSDLKNLCVSTALAAVREENELLSQHKEDKDFKLPERRTLSTKHFDRAIAEISASINEDMSSLVAIKKFDEKFGDRRGRKKKSAYGFGGAPIEADESAARVRQDQDRPRP